MKLNDEFFGICISFFPQYLIKAILLGEFQEIAPSWFFSMLILCGFHEATLMCQSAYKIINPNKKNILKYTTVSGVKGFDGTTKKTDNSIIKTIS